MISSLIKNQIVGMQQFMPIIKTKTKRNETKQIVKGS